MEFIQEKRPRHYAAKILQVRDPDKREELINTRVPQHFIAMVRDHIDTALSLTHAWYAR